MSVLKRLGNVARGKMIEIGRGLSGDDGGDEPDELDPDRPPRAPRATSSAASGSAPRTPEGKRALLARMKEEGLLTDAEYEEKVAALDAPPPPPVARKRRL